SAAPGLALDRTPPNNDGKGLETLRNTSSDDSPDLNRPNEPVRDPTGLSSNWVGLEASVGLWVSSIEDPDESLEAEDGRSGSEERRRRADGGDGGGDDEEEESESLRISSIVRWGNELSWSSSSSSSLER
ncbi:hypothetical protein TorRG33x02_069660, partial [Trema orientale]